MQPNVEEQTRVGDFGVEVAMMMIDLEDTEEFVVEKSAFRAELRNSSDFVFWASAEVFTKQPNGWLKARTLPPP